MLLCLIDDGCCAQSAADLADDFISAPSSRDASAAVDVRFVAPVSKLTKLPKPAPATGSSSAKKRRSASQKAGDSEPSDGDGDFKPKHNPFHGDNCKAAAIDAPKRAAKPTAIPSSPVESAASDGQSVAPVSKLTQPAPATDAAMLKAELKRWCGRKSAGAHT